LKWVIIPLAEWIWLAMDGMKKALFSVRMGITALWIQGVVYCGDFVSGYSHLENITIITEPRSENCFNITTSTGFKATEVS